MLQCDAEYGANGSDIFERKCPVCQGASLALQPLEGIVPQPFRQPVRGQA